MSINGTYHVPLPSCSSWEICTFTSMAMLFVRSSFLSSLLTTLLRDLTLLENVFGELTYWDYVSQIPLFLDSWYLSLIYPLLHLISSPTLLSCFHRWLFGFDILVRCGKAADIYSILFVRSGAFFLWHVCRCSCSSRLILTSLDCSVRWRLMFETLMLAPFSSTLLLKNSTL